MRLGLYRKLRFFNTPKYDNKKYWSGKGGNEHFEKREQTDDFSTIKQMTFLKSYLPNLEYKSVFELACGYGRFTKLISINNQIEYYEGIDINANQIKNAKQRCGNKINFKVCDFRDYEQDRKFDLVFGAEILLHIKPEDVDIIIKKLIALSNKDIIIMDMGKKYQKILKNQVVNKDTMCFAHDIKSLFQNNSNVKSVIELDASEKSSMYHIKIIKPN